jgi:two-component system sensor histidine kinase/response regulator
MTKEISFRRSMISSMGLVAVIVLVGGAWFWQTQKQHLRQSAEAGLESIALLKVGEITAWRANQLRNGAILMDEPFLRQAVAHWMALGQAEDAEQILTRFRALQKHYQYIDVLWVDTEGQIRLSLSGIGSKIHLEALQTLSAALRGQRPLLTDLHAGPGSLPPHVDITVPFFSQDGEVAAPLGAVFLLVDARQFLYPMIKSWPTPSRSAETLLVRQDAGAVLFLNDLRHRADTALSLRIPMSRNDVTAVMAVQGRAGIVQGRDYRGVEVLSCLMAVPDSSWFMVAKVDTAEVFADWRSRSVLIVSLIALSMISALVVVGIIWQRDKKLNLRNLLQTQAALKASDVRFRGIFENAINGVAIHEIVLDENGAPADYIFLEVNAAFETHTGLRIADVIGKRVTEVLPGIEKSRFIDIYGNVVLSGKGITFEQFSEQLGRYYNISAFRVDQGRFATVFQDITKGKLAQVELQGSESRIRAITGSAQDAIVMMDPDRRVSYWNPAAERIFGYTSSEAIGQNLHELIAPQRFHPGHAAAFPEFKRTGRGSAVGKTIELQALHKDGHEISVDLSLSAVQGQGGWHAIGILRDMSERKRAEEILRETNRDLERATLHANEMAVQAELANAAKSEFLANMSHEIRTPMNGVIGMTGLLLDTELSSEQRRYAEIVRSSAESLLSLINDILDFSKIEARKMELEILDFDLRVTLEDTVEILANRAHSKGLEVICLIAPEVPSSLRGDPGRLRQVILNMAGNGIKFTHQGEVSLRVSLAAETVEKVQLRFEIADSGIGIPEIMIPLLFSPFTQVDGSTTRKFEGTGLGLAISKQLAELMGGQVGVTSKAGKGSTFWFTAAFEKMSPDRTVPDDRGELKGLRVLIVDDNETNRLLLATLLKSWGCLFKEACDAEQALEALKRAAAGGHPFEITVIDMLMPGTDGEELGRVIKGSSAIRDTRLVMMTSLGERGQAKRLKAIGFCGYLTKPIRQSQVRECLALVMGRTPKADTQPLKDIITRHTVVESRKRRLRILVAEDNTTNQILALEILKRLGYRADVVANGKEAVSAVQAIPYDLVLMDCQMPEMDGFEATRKIRELEAGSSKLEAGFPSAFPHIPIIAMTAHALKGDRERCLEAGMSDYLSKPVKPNDLALMLERWLQETADIPRTVHAAGEKRASARSDDHPPGAECDDFPGETTEAAIFDRDGFMNRVMNDAELAETITHAFLADMPTQIEKLAAAAADNDARQSEQHAHRIKGAAANLGAQALEQAAWAMEQAGTAGDVSKLQDLMPGVTRQFEILRAALEKAQVEPIQS